MLLTRYSVQKAGTGTEGWKGRRKKMEPAQWLYKNHYPRIDTEVLDFLEYQPHLKNIIAPFILSDFTHISRNCMLPNVLISSFLMDHRYSCKCLLIWRGKNLYSICFHITCMQFPSFAVHNLILFGLHLEKNICI